MTDELNKFVLDLNEEHGSPPAALEFASNEAVKSGEKNALYTLSWWRDVKRELRCLISS